MNRTVFARAGLFTCAVLNAACGNDADGPSGQGGTAGTPGSTAGAGGSMGGAAGSAGNSPVEGCLSELAPAGAFFEVQAFETDDGSLRLWRARRPGDRSAVGETFAYDLVGFAIDSDAERTCLHDGAAFSYEFGHHNWNETWEARTSAARYRGREEYVFTVEDAEWHDTLTVYPLTGEIPSMDPVTLREAGCYSIPRDLNPCFRRQRTD